MKAKAGLAFGMITLGLAAAAVYGSEYNFYEQADKKGCASIITERGQDECARVQRAKDDACSVPVQCDVDKQERLIATYKEAKERLDSGKVNDSDKDKLRIRYARSKSSLTPTRKQPVTAHRKSRVACVRERTCRSGSWSPASG